MSELLTIKNDALTVTVSTFGAEIKSVKGDKEYMWDSNPDVWAKSAPVLFPICGTLKGGEYSYKGKTYSMQSHGFAPKSEYNVREHTADSLTLYITDTEETLEKYPFKFDFEVKFTLNGTSLKVEYNVTNTGSEELYYSVGCHEAYACPEGIEEYYLEFSDKLDLDEHVLDGPFMSGETKPFARECDVLPLTEKLFENDSTCFKNMGAYSVTLKNKQGTRSVKVDYPDFEYFIIWHIPGAPYICLEPWKGFPDYTSTDGDFTKKDGIIRVEAGQISKSEHTITFA